MFKHHSHNTQCATFAAIAHFLDSVCVMLVSRLDTVERNSAYCNKRSGFRQSERGDAGASTLTQPWLTTFSL